MNRSISCPYLRTGQSPSRKNQGIPCFPRMRIEQIQHLENIVEHRPNLRTARCLVRENQKFPRFTRMRIEKIRNLENIDEHRPWLPIRPCLRSVPIHVPVLSSSASPSQFCPRPRYCFRPRPRQRLRSVHIPVPALSPSPSPPSLCPRPYPRPRTRRNNYFWVSKKFLSSTGV